MTGRHPAKYSASVLEVMRGIIEAHDLRNATIVDPFAGSGRCYELEDAMPWPNGRNNFVIGIELEPDGDKRNTVDDCIKWMQAAAVMRLIPTAIFTSPCYGNRFADRDMRESCAGTYMKWLGREASPGSACHLQWGPKYQEFHLRFIKAAFDFLPSGGLFVLNMSNHIRGEAEMPVVAWWMGAMLDAGFLPGTAHQVETPRQRKGANHDARVDCEWVIEFTKPA